MFFFLYILSFFFLLFLCPALSCQEYGLPTFFGSDIPRTVSTRTIALSNDVANRFSLILVSDYLHFIIAQDYL